MLIAWYEVFGRRRHLASDDGCEPAALVFLVVLVANAALSYAYSKNEIVSVAGVFYAVIAYVALRELLQRAPSSWRGHSDRRARARPEQRVGGPRRRPASQPAPRGRSRRAPAGRTS
jgi:hypothetical protein